MYDTIIIGAGLSGLAAGIRLAHFDRRVCIVERHTTIGGLNSFYRLRGRDYDVGLHAVTNFTSKGAKHGPLARLLRQLRFRWDDFGLVPQTSSSIAFPDVTLRFSNDIELLESEIAAKFPREIDNFRTLATNLIDYDDLEGPEHRLSARQHVVSVISDPLLREMLFCPVMWYGNARQHDMDYGQFSIMFRSIFLEGFARPAAGIRLILRNLVRRFRGLGGELKLRSGVRRICVQDGRAVGVELENGAQLMAGNVVSSAGMVETMRLADTRAPVTPVEPGELSFIEAISILDKPPGDLGHDQTIVFFNDSNSFHWKRPTETLCDTRTGVICSPDNFQYEQRSSREGVVRVSMLADYGGWSRLPEDQYQLQKLAWYDRATETATRYVPDYRHRVIDTDLFTPRTIHRFTGHENGAVYGAPHKQLDGRTPIEKLYICGTDQGYVGIIGTIVSGIMIANRYLLTDL